MKLHKPVTKSRFLTVIGRAFIYTIISVAATLHILEYHTPRSMEPMEPDNRYEIMSESPIEIDGKDENNRGSF